MLEVGQVFDGKYKILNKVGQGGMSVVYLAMNEKANKQWAVKEVRKDGVLDFEAVKQGLVAETDILKKLSHPNLPSIIDVIDTEDSFIIIMDYIQGNSLNKALDEFGAQPQENVIEWAKQLCDVLGYLHSRNPAIIYRDMKPANIMLKPDGNITLIDFGTAREFKEKNLADTTCLGTVGYAAPEQFGGMGQTDARTDIYCLGATLYHLVTGKNPCEPPYEILPIRQINPSLSSGLENIIIKCTKSNPAERYQSAAELMYALEHYEEDDTKYRQKQKKKLGMFIASIAMSLVFAATSVFGYVSAEKTKTADYDNIIATATSVDDYYKAITTDPTRTEAYLGSADFKGLIEFLISDGELTAEESSSFVKLKGGLDQENAQNYSTTIDVLSPIIERNDGSYEQICYEIGEAYLFYYNVNVEKDKYKAAAEWFQYAKDDERYPAAKVYCDISDCLQNIAKYAKSQQTAKEAEEYENLWNKINELNDKTSGFDDDLKIKVWEEIVKMIANADNLEKFVQISSKDDVTKLLDTILSDSGKVTNTFVQENINSLKTDIEQTRLKVQSKDKNE